MNSTYGTVTLNGEGVFAIKLDTSGNVLEGIIGEGLAISYASEIDNAGNLIISGAAEGDAINFDGEGYEYSTSTSKGFFVLRYYLDADSCIEDTMDAIHEIEVINELIILPNPSQGYFNLVFESDRIQEVEINVYDISGKQIHKTTAYLNSGENNIPLQVDAAQGYYTVEMHTQKYLYVGRVLIE